MRKGWGVWLGEEGEDAGPNMPAEGDGRWKGVGKVGHAGWWEVSEVMGSYSGGLLSLMV